MIPIISKFKVLITISFFLFGSGFPCIAENISHEFFKSEIVFYVSPVGSDSKSGTSIDNAFASLQKARDVIRALKLDGGLKSPVTVYLLGGIYELSEPFILTTEDSGSEAYPITYRAYNNSQPIIRGGRTSHIHQLLILHGDLKCQKYVQFVNFSCLTFSDAGYVLPNEKISTISGLENFEKPAAITFDGTKFCTFENNCIRNVGTYALEVTGDANKITHNKIYDTGGGGIIIHSYGKEPNRILYNDIHNCGKIFFTACGINVADGGGEITHNLIHDISYSGVYAGNLDVKNRDQERRNQGQALVIEHNEIHRVMLKMNNGGGISVRDSNIIIRNNLIYDVITNPGSGDPGFGIYLGDRTRNSIVENNIIDRASSGIYFGHFNNQNTIVNNLFIDIQDHIVGINNPYSRGNENIRFIRNIVYSTRSDVCIYKIDKGLSLPAESDYNVYWNPYECFLHISFLRLSNPLYVKDFEGVEFFLEWQKMGFDKNSIVWNPNFINLFRSDYSLSLNSVAFMVGFKNIDISNVGLRGKSNKIMENTEPEY